MNDSINRRYTFDSFTIGESNRRAYAISKAIAESPGKRYNPCVIYGGVGLGSTHLMCAIGNAMRCQYPKARVLYTNVEQFVLEYTLAVRAKRLPPFRSRYRSLDCLLIDDIQFLVTRKRPEEELLHIINERVGMRKQVVITSDRSPKDVLSLDSLLIARLESGTSVGIKSPSLKTRIAILRKKADQEGVSLPDDVILFVASLITGSVSLLECALIRLKAYKSMTGSVSLADAQGLLKDF